MLLPVLDGKVVRFVSFGADSLEMRSVTVTGTVALQ